MFDVGNTLLYPFPSVSSVVLEVLSVHGHAHDLGAIDELMPLVEQYYEDRYRADDTFWTNEEETSDVWVGMYSLLCRRLGIAEEAEAIARRVYDEFGAPGRWRYYEDVPGVLSRLRDSGMKTGVVSNWDSRLTSLLHGLGLTAGLDAVVSSAEVNLHKPDPRIFELACARLEVRPEEAAHVGDHYYADVLGARTAGLRPVMIDRRGACMPEGMEVISSLDELDDLLS